MSKGDFVVAVDRAVKREYGLDDGGDLAYNLYEQIKDMSVAGAAAYVAQLMEQQ